MKIACLGSAPSSVRLAPFGDPSWTIWGCSPGCFAVAPRSDVWFELHRWEPGVLGKAETQKPWFSPEYVAWLCQHPKVYMIECPAEVKNAVALPWQQLITIYGAFFMNSTLSWMLAMAIEAIKEDRATRTTPKEEWDDKIGLWGVDMSATEEYGYQRAGCQFFVQMARNLMIDVIVPDESDLLRHPPLYGVCEHWPQHIKTLARLKELKHRNDMAKQQLAFAQREQDYTQGLIDDANYHLNTWLNVPDTPGFHMPSIMQTSEERARAAQEWAGQVQTKADGCKSIIEASTGTPAEFNYDGGSLGTTVIYDPDGNVMEFGYAVNPDPEPVRKRRKR